MARTFVTFVLISLLLPAASQAAGSHGLLKAARTGDTRLVQAALDRGADANSAGENGATALHLAAAWGHETMAGLLIESGADVNAAGPRDNTPLHFAAQEGHAGIVDLLLAAGADVTVRNSAGGTAMKFAVGWGHRDVVAALKAYAAPAPDAVSPTHRIYAALAGILAIVAIPIMGISTVHALAQAPNVHFVR